MTELYEQDLEYAKGREKAGKILRLANNRFPGAKGVTCPNEDAYFLAIDCDTGEAMKIVMYVANKSKELNIDHRLGIKLDGNTYNWNLAIDFRPFSDDLEVLGY